MNVVVITPPPVLAVSLDEAKRHLRVDEEDADDASITGLIAAAQSWIDAPHGWLGRALITQTLELRANSFACDLPLPFAPLQSVVTVKFDDSADVEQTLSSPSYRVLGIGARGHLQPFNAWPTSSQRDESVRIRYIAGYGSAASDVPAAIRHALLLLVSHFFENREAEITGPRAAAIELPTGVAALLSPFRIY